MAFTDLLSFSIHSMLFMLIWLVQAIIYPSFLQIPDNTFLRWHPVYTRLISYFVAPLMLLQVALIILQLIQSASLVWSIAQALLVAVVWINTFLVAVPLHGKIQHKPNDQSKKALVRANWWRTLAWTGVWLLEWGRWQFMMTF